MGRKKITLVVAATALIALPQPALAAFECTGAVNASYLTADGSVIIRGLWRNDYTQICNLKATWKGITPDICAGWKAMADAAVSLGRQMNIYYTETGACETIPYYGSAPAPYYLMLL